MKVDVGVDLDSTVRRRSGRGKGVIEKIASVHGGDRGGRSRTETELLRR